MRLICPACGAISSAEAMGNDALVRETMAMIVKLPHPLPSAVLLSYLPLFRPSAERALSWKKAKRLVTEVEELITPGYVSVQGKIDRDCPSRIWAAAMDAMAVNPTIKRPMKSHNYLRQVAHDLAEKEAGERETTCATPYRRPEVDPANDFFAKYDQAHGED